MPVLPSNPYSAGADIGTLIRALCMDTQGQFFTDTLLLPYVNSAARRIATELANNGQQTLTIDNLILTIPAVTAVDPGQIVTLGFTGISGNVTPATTPALPPNLLFPEVLWERLTASVDNFREMYNRTALGGLPSRQQGIALGDWEWVTDAINFVGSTMSRDIRVRYRASTIAFSLSGNPAVLTGALGELDAIDAISYYAAAEVLAPRGSVLAPGYATEAGKLIEQLVSSSVRQQQYRGARPKPFRGMGSARNTVIW